mmetsp:Transcript_8417/g.35195  ORF Transcript_8417/g.35195 Transcript_8417/m.35195 type:complete len:201 (-) Transcript_8417:758-1360(-)
MQVERVGLGLVHERNALLANCEGNERNDARHAVQCARERLMHLHDHLLLHPEAGVGEVVEAALGEVGEFRGVHLEELGVHKGLLLPVDAQHKAERADRRDRRAAVLAVHRTKANVAQLDDGVVELLARKCGRVLSADSAKDLLDDHGRDAVDNDLRIEEAHDVVVVRHDDRPAEDARHDEGAVGQPVHLWAGEDEGVSED